MYFDLSITETDSNNFLNTLITANKLSSNSNLLHTHVQCAHHSTFFSVYYDHRLYIHIICDYDYIIYCNCPLYIEVSLYLKNMFY